MSKADASLLNISPTSLIRPSATFSRLKKREKVIIIGEPSTALRAGEGPRSGGEGYALNPSKILS
jgi:hypothetical protein